MCAIDSLTAILRSPIARRKGVTISPEECAIWAEEIDKEMTHIREDLKRGYEARWKLGLTPLGKIRIK